MKYLNVKMMVAMTMALAVSGCSSEGITGGNGNDGEVRFSATIDEASRAYNQAWEANDEIGISCQTGDVTYSNVCYYTASGDGDFSSKDDGNKIYFQTDEEVTFTAYYPWNNLQEGSTVVTADTWGQAGQSNFDFLWAQAKGKKSAPDVSLGFEHRMAKLVLTIKRGDDVSYDEVKAAVLSLEGFKNSGSFDVATGVAAASGEKSGKWTFAGNTSTENNAPYTRDDATSTVSYTLILYPQALDSSVIFTAQFTGEQSFTAGLDFTNANAIKDGSAARNEWVAGRQYNMGVRLNKTEISLEGCTIAAWDELDGGDVDAQ